MKFLRQKNVPIALGISLFSSVVLAGDSGTLSQWSSFYAGIQGGYGHQYLKTGNPVNHFDGNVMASVKTKKSNDGIAGRLIAGFSFNPYLSIEGGISKYKNLDWIFTTTLVSGSKAIHTMEFETYTLELLGRVSYDLFNRLNVFGKGGIAYVNSDVKLSGKINLTQKTYRPAIAFGFNIPLTEAMDAEVTYSHVFRKGNLHLSEHTPALDALLVGITVHV